MSTAPGWAIRRSGSCLLPEENDCGQTVAPYRACCPSSTTCINQYNTICCPSNTNCTAEFVKTPLCADRSWIMFNNNGYFCCLNGQVGFNLGGSDGCSPSGIDLPDNAKPLAVISQASSSTSTSTSSTSTSSSTPSPPPASTPTAISTSSTSVSGGTITGAVIGGIAGIIIIAGILWFFMRKKKSSDTTASAVSQLPSQEYQSRDEGNQYYGGYQFMPTEPTPAMNESPKAELPDMMMQRELP
ncbi:hypothetical protein GGS21DRAFT_318102 [Xylaria nigripes]|nr:hypothetical protein GGS21DRAFT_318102 [Xylaria nigripes]